MGVPACAGGYLPEQQHPAGNARFGWSRNSRSMMSGLLRIA